jgi:glycosyltransferase involved in cell wall biosynthesis
MDLDEDEWTSYHEMAAILRPSDPGGALWADAEADAFSSLIDRSAHGISRSFISNEQEADKIRKRHPAIGVEVIQNAVAMPHRVRREHDGATLLFTGSFSYLPNVDAATWFVDSVWPTVRSSVKANMRLLVVGRDARRLTSLVDRPGVLVRSDVEDVADAFAQATLFVAPLRAGAGTRLKLLEAAAHGVPIISTSIGSRGLPLVPGRDLLIADDESGFVDAICKAISDEADSTRRAESARSIVYQSFDIERVTAGLSCRLRDIAAT